jgi:PilZ domain-containing protein
MPYSSEKRRSQRVPAGSRGTGRVKTSVPFKVIDVSGVGMQLEVATALRPGSTYDLNASLDDFSLTAQVRITRCRAGGYVPDGKGGRLLLYRAGAEFLDLPDGQVKELHEWMAQRKEHPSGELVKPLKEVDS